MKVYKSSWSSGNSLSGLLITLVLPWPADARCLVFAENEVLLICFSGLGGSLPEEVPFDGTNEDQLYIRAANTGMVEKEAFL